MMIELKKQEAIDKITDFVYDWLENNGVLTQDEQIATFVSELQNQISRMDFSLKEGTTVIGYTGNSNDSNCWRIAKNVSETYEGGAVYISDLPAGALLNDTDFKEAIYELFDENEAVQVKVINGYDISNGGWNNAVRLEGGSCGYGDLLSLDDFVSSKLMGETVGASSNLIIFCPEEVDMTKVLPVTEMKNILANDTWQYINGIPKSEIKALYDSGNTEAVFQVISRVSRETSHTKKKPLSIGMIQLIDM